MDNDIPLGTIILFFSPFFPPFFFFYTFFLFWNQRYLLNEMIQEALSDTASAEFNEQLTSIEKNLNGYFEQSKGLENSIIKNLSALNYD